MRKFFSYILLLASLNSVGQAIQFGKLGQGFNGVYSTVRTVFYDTIDKKLYAGGHFKFTSNKLVNGVASWNGTSWDSLQGGFTQTPHYNNPGNSASDGWPWQIIRFQNKIYFIGAITWVNGKNQYHMAVWNGTSWDYPIAQPPNDRVYNLVVYNNELYACGQFTKFGNTTCNYVAKFDGVSWQPVGDLSKYFKTYIPPAQINCLAVYNNELYMGGAFLDSAGKSTNFVKYDGTKWTTAGTGISQGFAWINRMETFKGKLYIGGYFAKNSQTPGNGLVRFNGNNFEPIGTFDVSDGSSITHFHKTKDRLFVMGNFQEIGPQKACNIMYVDSLRACAIDSLNYSCSIPSNSGFHSCTTINDSLIIGGEFIYLDTVIANKIGIVYNYKNNSSCLTTDIKENELNPFHVKIYPNPASDKITIELESGQNIQSLNITNILGQNIMEIINSQASQVINIASLQQGIYFLNIQVEGQRKTYKIIKE